MGSGRGWLAGNWPSTGSVLNITAAAWTVGGLPMVTFWRHKATANYATLNINVFYNKYEVYLIKHFDHIFLIILLNLIKL